MPDNLVAVHAGSGKKKGKSAKSSSAAAAPTSAPSAANSLALLTLRQDLHLLSLEAEKVIASAVTNILKEGLGPNVVKATESDRQLAILFATTQAVNAVWGAATNVAQAVLTPPAGKVLTIRATPLSRPHKGCLRFFVCETDAQRSDGISNDARDCC